MALAQAYYAEDNNQHFITANQAPSADVDIYDENGELVPYSPLPPASEIRGRYPLRLAKYLEGQLAGSIFVNEGTQFVNGAWQKELQAGESPFFNTSAYFVSLFPSFGLNSRYVGGHTDVDTASWAPEVVRRPSLQAGNSAGLIAFTSARGYIPGAPWNASNPEIIEAPGYYYVSPPTYGLGWSSSDYDAYNAPASDWGQVAFRYDGRAIVGFCDGHAEALGVESLRDMQLWSNRARALGDSNHTPTP